jgi:hypothetical protein
MHRGGDASLVSSDWVEAHIHGHGALGDIYPNYRGGDIWSRTLGPVRGIKEGDTPSFLTLIPNGLFDPDRPWLGSWGGRFRGEGHQLTDIPDPDIDTRADPDPRMSSVYRWRAAFQNDFAARLDWCVKPFQGANHPPAVRISGEPIRPAKPGASIILDGSGTSDPDGDALTFEWSIDPDDPEVVKGVMLRGGDTSIPRIEVSPTLTGKTVPVLLTVRDSGTPSLTRHGRVLLQVGASE